MATAPPNRLTAVTNREKDRTTLRQATDVTSAPVEVKQLAATSAAWRIALEKRLPMTAGQEKRINIFR